MLVYCWLLKVISPYAIIICFKLYYHKLFVATLLVAILFVAISGYLKLNYHILLIIIDETILLMIIGGYFIINYCWIF